MKFDKVFYLDTKENEFSFLDFKKSLLDDSLYVSCFSSDLTSEMFEKIQTTNIVKKRMNKILAGNILEEYNLDFSEDMEFYSRIYERLRIHLSSVFDQNIREYSFLDSGMWINFQTKHEFNPLHNHAGDVSFVWYIDIPLQVKENYKKSLSETEEIYSNSMRKGLIEFSSSSKNISITISPNSGDIIIFNSEQRHQVYPFDCDGVRISISGNIENIRTFDGNLIKLK